MKKSLFNPDHHFFHINLDFTVHPIFKELDWIFLQTKISGLTKTYSIRLHALVMMDTHAHLLIQSNEQKENFFCEKLIETLQSSANPAEHHCEPVLNYPQFLNAYKYIYRNPVEAGLCEKVEDYPYSSLKILMGTGLARCEVIDYLGLIHNPISQLRWLNNQQEFRFSKLSDFAKNVEI